ncbi:hypothetical protein P4U65_19165 [Bacillus pacificus]|nr:hypothetical protein [Bacillus thuringiensis]MED1302645.1 hypothetical protein [Bacillus pacificus]
MKTKVLSAVLAIAAVAIFTFAPATKQGKVEEVDAPVLYVDPNPGGG